ncbi:MAG: rRNA maturation RNase YbeY [Lachnospiraceae bacterium]|nr:rRNA maturation RNase YbeY [Lachnospiraceae bacterium]
MTLDISCEVGVEKENGALELEGFDFDPGDVARQVIDGALVYEGFPYECEVSLLITDANEVHQMNKEVRGIDSTTDVLSFPMIDYSGLESFDDLEDMDDIFNPETGEVMLGDIVINHERVLSQAREYGHSVRREYAFLIAHSMLHLLGYDHMDEDERADMEKRQSDILNKLGITREDS